MITKAEQTNICETEVFMGEICMSSIVSGNLCVTEDGIQIV